MEALHAKDAVLVYVNDIDLGRPLVDLPESK